MEKDPIPLVGHSLAGSKHAGKYDPEECTQLVAKEGLGAAACQARKLVL